MKKLFMFCMLFCICAGLLTGCGGTGKKEAASDKNIKELKVALSPYQDAETIKTVTGPLSGLLQKKLNKLNLLLRK